jgi:hypothetical protein
MPRVKISQARRGVRSLDIEIGRLRDLDIKELRARWHTQSGRRPPEHLPRHLLFRLLAYRLQSEALGDLDGECQRLLKSSATPSAAGKNSTSLNGLASTIQKGTILTREWKGRVHRVAVLTNGFAWNGDTYPSLSKVAFAITGTRWNGPRFFGLRDQPSLNRRLSDDC